MKPKNIAGMTFGKLTSTEMVGSKNGRALWKCVCDCGNFAIVEGAKLRNGHTRSCGCLFTETRKAGCHFKHGATNTKAHRAWATLKSRCSNPNVRNYMSYGGRGITICDRWNDFLEFYKDMGNPPSPKHQIDRIDNNEGYYPENCHWVLPLYQARNKRNIKFTYEKAQEVRRKYDKRKYSYTKLAKEYGCSSSTVWSIVKNKTWVTP